MAYETSNNNNMSNTPNGSNNQRASSRNVNNNLQQAQSEASRLDLKAFNDKTYRDARNYVLKSQESNQKQQQKKKIRKITVGEEQYCECLFKQSSEIVHKLIALEKITGNDNIDSEQGIGLEVGNSIARGTANTSAVDVSFEFSEKNIEQLRIDVQGLATYTSQYAEYLNTGTLNSSAQNLLNNVVSNNSLITQVNNFCTNISSGPSLAPAWNNAFGLTSAFGGGTTLSFSEQSTGWVSFKSFIPESGLSVSGNYYTFNQGKAYQHHVGETYNNFYGIDYFTEITAIMNEASGSIKSFTTVNYEGTQSRIIESITETISKPRYNPGTGTFSLLGIPGNITYQNVTFSDGEYYNLNAKDGWFLDYMITDLQRGSIKEFINKEGKWFNHIRGIERTHKGNTLVGGSINTSEFSFQGLGYGSNISYEGPPLGNFIMIADINDKSDHAAGGWYWQQNKFDSWDQNPSIAPWNTSPSYIITHDQTNEFNLSPTGYPGNFICVGKIDTIPVNVPQINKTYKVTVIPIAYDSLGPGQGCLWYPVTAHGLGINRMFPRMCANPMNNTQQQLMSAIGGPNYQTTPFPTAAFSTFTTPYYEITPLGSIAPHGLGHTKYEITPLTDFDGLGFNYFSKPGWDMYLTTQDSDIFIKKILIKENYNTTYINHENFPGSIDIYVTLSDYQLDSMTNNIGQSTPLRNKYLPLDIDWYACSVPPPLFGIMQEYNQTPLNGTYMSSSQQFIVPDSGNAQWYSQANGVISNSGNTNPGVGMNYTPAVQVPNANGNPKFIIPAIDLNSNVSLVNNTPPTTPNVDFNLIYGVYANPIQSNTLNIVDGVFPNQIKISPNLSDFNTFSGITLTTAGYNWDYTSEHGNPYFVLDPGDFRSYVENIKFMDVSGGGTTPTESPSTFFVENELSFTPQIYDFHVDIEKYNHDLSSGPDTPIQGCTDPTAMNYNPAAVIDDGSCQYCVYGCMDAAALNYSAAATCDDGSCIYPQPGCTYQLADNYDSNANVDDGSCIWSICSDPNANNHKMICGSPLPFQNSPFIYPMSPDPPLQLNPLIGGGTAAGILGFNILPDTVCCTYNFLCENPGSFNDCDWGSSLDSNTYDSLNPYTSAQQLNSGGFWVGYSGASGGAFGGAGGGNWNYDIVPANVPGLGIENWVNSQGTYLEDIIFCTNSAPGMKKHMDMAWQAVFNYEISTDWVRFVSDDGNCAHSAWGHMGGAAPDITGPCFGNPPIDPNNTNTIFFYGGHPINAFDPANLDYQLNKVMYSTLAAVEIPVISPHQYTIFIDIKYDVGYTDLVGGQDEIIKLGFGDSSSWSVFDSPTSSFQETGSYNMGDAHSANRYKESFVEGTIVVEEALCQSNGGSGGVVTYSFNTNLQHINTLIGYNPILMIQHFGVVSSNVCISDIRIKCAETGPGGPGGPTELGMKKLNTEINTAAIRARRKERPISLEDEIKNKNIK